MDVSELRRGRRSGRRSGRLSDELNILSPPSEPEFPCVRAALCASSCERVGRCGAPRGGGPRPRGGGPFSPREGRLGGGGGRLEGCRDGVFCAALSSRLRLFCVHGQQGVGVTSRSRRGRDRIEQGAAGAQHQAGQRHGGAEDVPKEKGETYEEILGEGRSRLIVGRRHAAWRLHSWLLCWERVAVARVGVVVRVEKRVPRGRSGRRVIKRRVRWGRRKLVGADAVGRRSAVAKGVV